MQVWFWQLTLSKAACSSVEIWSTTILSDDGVEGSEYSYYISCVFASTPAECLLLSCNIETDEMAN